MDTYELGDEKIVKPEPISTKKIAYVRRELLDEARAWARLWKRAAKVKRWNWKRQKRLNELFVKHNNSLRAYNQSLKVERGEARFWTRRMYRRALEAEDHIQNGRELIQMLMANIVDERSKTEKAEAERDELRKLVGLLEARLEILSRKSYTQTSGGIISPRPRKETPEA